MSVVLRSSYLVIGRFFGWHGLPIGRRVHRTKPAKIPLRSLRKSCQGLLWRLEASLKMAADVNHWRAESTIEYIDMTMRAWNCHHLHKHNKKFLLLLNEPLLVCLICSVLWWFELYLR